MKEDDVTRKKYFNKKVTVENTAGVEILGAHGTDKQNVTVDEEILTKTSDESKLEDGYITWTITYKPYGFLDKDAKITLDDILSEGMELRKYKSDNTLIFEGDNFKVKEDNTNLMGEGLSDMFTYDGSNRTLKIKLKDKTKTYTISYITDITDVKKAGDGLSNTVKVIEGTVELPMEPNKKDYIIGNAYANATLKGYKSFRVIKTDSADSNKKLKGAKFRLKAKDSGTNYDKEEATDNNGIVVFYKLTEGEYELIETVAPKDSNGKSYTLDSTPRIIKVRELGAGFEVTLPDGTKSNEITITNSLPGDTPPPTPPTDPTDPPTPTTSTDPNPPTPPTTPTIPTTPTDPTPSTPPTTPTTPPTDPTPSTPPTTPTTPTTPTVPEDPDTEDPEDPDTEEPEDPETPETPDPEEPDVPTDPTPTAPAYNINEVPDPNDPDSPDEITVIGEDGTPLGTFIKKKKPDGTFEYVLADDGTPLGAFKAKEKLPNTGGSNNLWYYTAGAGLILAAVFALKKREEEQ